jgi:hypothetical protein
MIHQLLYLPWQGISVRDIASVNGEQWIVSIEWSADV